MHGVSGPDQSPEGVNFLKRYEYEGLSDLLSDSLFPQIYDVLFQDRQEKQDTFPECGNLTGGGKMSGTLRIPIFQCCEQQNGESGNNIQKNGAKTKSGRCGKFESLAETSFDMQ